MARLITSLTPTGKSNLAGGAATEVLARAVNAVERRIAFFA
jgi:hypothetical protein